MAFATDKEIEYAEGLLLPRGAHFNDDRREIIKCNESKAFHACPGSGKTTTLLAKIIILANRMPLDGGKGICVLTHTNVAIDEIKARLSEKANVLFTYPNFFGTFQTFVHTFFTEQALWYYYQSKIRYVDDNYAVKKLLYTLFPKREKLYGCMLGRWNGTHSKLPFDTYRKNFILRWNIDWINQVIIPDKGYGDVLSFACDSGKEIIAAKDSLFEQGILTYDDAYYLALRYIREMGEQKCKKMLSNRFEYVFIDEQQDMNPLQQELAKAIFDDEQVVIQRFGDTDQSIYHGNGSEAEVLPEEEDNSIDDSCRFGPLIAQVLQSVCVREYINLRGDASVETHKPMMIVYTDPTSVLPKFASLLQTYTIGGETIAACAKRYHEEDAAHRHFVKAIGFRVEHEQETATSINVKSYYPDYERTNVVVKNEITHISDYLRTGANDGVKEYRTSIMNAIIVVLDLCEIKDDKGRRFNATSLFRYLRDMAPGKDVELKSKIARWMKMLANNEKQTIKEEMQQYIGSNLVVYMPDLQSAQTQIEQFFVEGDGDVPNERTANATNIYHDEQTGVDIEVASVHAVKGETHMATLYMETTYYGYTESQVLKKALEGDVYKKDGGRRIQISRLMYVGMSRPKHLLCFAINKDHFDRLDGAKVRQNWDVVEI